MCRVNAQKFHALRFPSMKCFPLTWTLIAKLIFAMAFAWVTGFTSLTHASAEPVQIVPHASELALQGHIEIFHDQAARWTAADFDNPSAATLFEPASGSSFNLGYLPGNVWYRFALRSPTDFDVPTSWVLDIAYPTLDAIDIFTSIGGIPKLQLHMGDLLHAPAGQIPYRNFAVKLDVPAHETLSVLMRVSNDALHYVPLRLWSHDAFTAQAVESTLIQGVIFGSVFLITLYNLIIFLAIRDRTYLFYVLWATTLIGFGLILTGYARQYGNQMFANAPAWMNMGLPYFWLLIGYSTNLLTRAFIDTRRQTKTLHHLSTLFLIVQTGWLIAIVFVPYSLAVRFSIMLTGLATFVSMTTAIWHAILGSRRARIYLLAWGPLFLLVIIGVIVVFGGMNGIERIIQDAEFAVTIGIMLVSLALADRIRRESQIATEARSNLQRLRSFLPAKVADIVVHASGNTLLEPKRRRVTVCVIDLRGFTPVTNSSTPDDVLDVLKGFFEAMGKVVESNDGTVEHFAGDSMVIFFNAPLEIDRADDKAVHAAVSMLKMFSDLRKSWRSKGIDLGLGIGIANGDATIGAIGFSGRYQYAAIGAVTNLAARLCSMATHGDILTTPEVMSQVSLGYQCEELGELAVKGFKDSINIVRILA